jgi:predicted nucleic acid-binding protein
MLLDTDVMVDFLRAYPPAVEWLTRYSLPIAIPGLVAMELLQGCRNPTEQQRVERELARFALYWPTLSDCQNAYRDFAAFRLSNGIGLLDSLVGHTAVGINEQLATFNVKHYAPIAGLQIVQPYQRAPATSTQMPPP